MKKRFPMSTHAQAIASVDAFVNMPLIDDEEMESVSPRMTLSRWTYQTLVECEDDVKRILFARTEHKWTNGALCRDVLMRIGKENAGVVALLCSMSGSDDASRTIWSMRPKEAEEKIYDAQRLVASASAVFVEKWNTMEPLRTRDGWRT